VTKRKIYKYLSAEFYMVKDDKKKGSSLEELASLEYGAVAGRLIKQSPELAKKALESLVNSYLTLDDATKEYLNHTFVNPKGEGVREAAKIYSNAYGEAKFALTIGDLSQYYDDVLKGYLKPEEAEPIRNEFGKFAAENFGKVMKKIRRANFILKGEGEYEFSEEEINGAKSVMEKYSGIYTLLEKLEEAKLFPLMEKVQKNSIKSDLKEISENLKQEQTRTKGEKK